MGSTTTSILCYYFCFSYGLLTAPPLFLSFNSITTLTSIAIISRNALLVVASSSKTDVNNDDGNEQHHHDNRSCAHSKIENENSDTLQRWSKRWAESKTRWHRDEVHEFLLKHGEQLLSSSSSNDNTDKKRVLVPLCGKTLDLEYLAKHDNVKEVVGVEGIEKAIIEFHNDHPYFNIQKQIDMEGEKESFFDMYVGTNVRLLKGNFFHFNDSFSNGKFDMIWDRASIIAINPKDRQIYVNILGSVLKPGGCILTTTINRSDDNTEGADAGPPFSINELDIRNLYENLDWVDSITKLDEGDMEENFRYELCFSVCSKI